MLVSSHRRCQISFSRESARPGNSFRPDVEGLRGVAILLVVGCHCGLFWCAGGFVGVDLFFVLSGYLITGLLATEIRASSRIDLPKFYARRARRLLPACALVILLTTLAAAAILAPPAIAFTGKAAGAAALYISNVFFDHSAADYFAPHVADNPLLHTWSLGLEEQFYLIWPLLIWLTYRGPRALQKTFWTLGAVTTLSLLSSVYLTPRWPTFAFYELPPRAWEFAAGGLLAILPASKVPVSSGGAAAVGAVGLAVILGTAVLVQGGSGFPGWVALLPVAGTLALLFAGAKTPKRGVSVLLSSVPLQFLGARSYSWYLWHWPFLVFAGILFPGLAVGGKVAAAVASLLAAHLTFLYLEHPVRESRFLSPRPWLSLSGATGAVLLTVAASWSLLAFGRHEVNVNEKFRAIGAANFDIADISPKDCWDEGRHFEVKLCEFGTPATAPVLVLLGDSHAIQWVNPLRTATKLQGWRLATILRPGCAASDINPYNLSPGNEHCRQWREEAIDRIIALHPAAVVMASYNGSTIRGDSWSPTLMPTDAIRTGTRWTLEKFSRTGIPVVVLRDTPLPPFHIPFCEGQREGGKLRAGQSCDFEATTALNAAAFAAERAAASGLTQVFFLDMDDIICPGARCPATNRGQLIYRDDNHLTGTYAASLAPVVRARLFQLLGDASATKLPGASYSGQPDVLAVSRFNQSSATRN
ncbi:MAG TPA: acyltransferase family protein [Steroidobacteraceae bacterium]